LSFEFWYNFGLLKWFVDVMDLGRPKQLGFYDNRMNWFQGTPLGIYFLHFLLDSGLKHGILIACRFWNLELVSAALK
jgi:hypothetical protein